MGFNINVLVFVLENLCFSMFLKGYSGGTLDEKFIEIPNDDTHNYPFCRWKLLVEKFEPTN